MSVPAPTSEAGRAALAGLLASPRGVLLGLDFDGTLAPIVDEPDRARVHPDIPPVLRRLAAMGVHIAVVTGRPAAESERFLARDDLD